MKTLSSMILGSVVAFSLAACSSTPMSSDTAVGGSQAGSTVTGNPTEGVGVNAPRAATPINCTNNTASDGTTASAMPGTQCPSESK